MEAATGYIIHAFLHAGVHHKESLVWFKAPGFCYTIHRYWALAGTLPGLPVVTLVTALGQQTDIHPPPLDPADHRRGRCCRFGQPISSPIFTTRVSSPVLLLLIHPLARSGASSPDFTSSGLSPPQGQFFHTYTYRASSTVLPRRGVGAADKRQGQGHRATSLLQTQGQLFHLHSVLMGEGRC